MLQLLLLSPIVLNAKLIFAPFMTKTSISYARIWQVAYPIILGSIAQNLISFTDTAFLGRVGEVALGAGALGGLFYLAVIMLGLGFGTGAQIIIARRYGESKLKEVGPVVDHTTLFLIVLAGFSFLLLRYGSVYILEHIVQSQRIYQGTMEFLEYRSFGIFFAFMNMTFRAFYVGLTKTKVITYTTVVLAAVNVVLDYALIFGEWGFPEMGLQGAALASVIAEAFALLFFVIYTFSAIRFPEYALFRFHDISFSRMKAILAISVPMMMQSFISLTVWFVFFIFIEKLGEASLAVSNIIRSFFVILMVPIWGFATATNSLVSFLIGKRKEEEVMSLITKIVTLCFFGVLLIVGFGLAFPRLILEIYTNDLKLIAMGVPLVYVVSGGALFLSVGFIFFNGVSGTGKTKISLFIEIIVLGIYLTYAYTVIQVFKAGVTIAWTAELLYGSLLALFSFAYLKTNKWRGGSMA
ncbi:MAG: MATE family efflux transporter [Bacteroidales bacterium]|nr:MATE family efflux transporter [Bacteroidales bacterium]